MRHNMARVLRRLSTVLGVLRENHSHHYHYHYHCHHHHHHHRRRQHHYLHPLHISSFQSARFSQSSHQRQIVSSKVEVNGAFIYYNQVGEGDHVVLLLPGSLGSSRTDFQPQVNGLSRKKYTLVCFHPRGYGQSRPPNRDWPLLFIQRDAEDACTLMKTLGFPHYSVLGWSDGGSTGLYLAGTYPGVVKKLLVWGAKAYVTKQEIKIFKGVEDVDNWSSRMRLPRFEIYGEEYFRSQWKQWISANNEVLRKRNGDFCIGSLPNIKCKTLIVNGFKDHMVSQVHAPFLQKHIANSRLVNWPKGKHNLHLRYHKEFNKLAEDFLDETD